MLWRQEPCPSHGLWPWCTPSNAWVLQDPHSIWTIHSFGTTSCPYYTVHLNTLRLFPWMLAFCTGQSWPPFTMAELLIIKVFLRLTLSKVSLQSELKIRSVLLRRPDYGRPSQQLTVTDQPRCQECSQKQGPVTWARLGFWHRTLNKLIRHFNYSGYTSKITARSLFCDATEGLQRDK